MSMGEEGLIVNDTHYTFSIIAMRLPVLTNSKAGMVRNEARARGRRQEADPATDRLL